jgi:hypothetical protein
MTYRDTIAKPEVHGTPGCAILRGIMQRRLIRLTKAAMLTAVRAFAALAVATKLLVPVGFMPAAIADGSPLRLCDGGRAAVMHGHMAMPAADAMAGSAHDHGKDGAGHHEWERCSLGGLASMAAVAFDMSFVIAEPGADHEPRPVAMDRRSIHRTRSFLARAPPVAPS